jgi:hypothetical protein
MTNIPSVREIPARDLQPGMRLEWGGTWQPPVSSVTTWGPGKDETPSRPSTWWTRVTVRAANDRLEERVFQPDFPVRVVGEVACHVCGQLTPTADVATVCRAARSTARSGVGRQADARPSIELRDLCPDCAADENGA